MDEIHARMGDAQGEEFTRLGNALSLAATALFNGHRTVAFLTGGVTPVKMPWGIGGLTLREAWMGVWRILAGARIPHGRDA